MQCNLKASNRQRRPQSPLPLRVRGVESLWDKSMKECGSMGAIIGE